MVRRSTFFCPMYKQLAAFILIFSNWNIRACSSIFFSETFESCGIFIADFQPISNKQSDVIHEVIKHLQISQKVGRPLIIKKKLAAREIHPDIFRSIKYDCYLYVHIYFEKKFFSTIPRLKTPSQSTLYQKTIFLLVTSHKPHSMVTRKSLNVHFERQYRIFIVIIKMVLRYNQLREQPFVLYKRFFLYFVSVVGYDLIKSTLILCL